MRLFRCSICNSICDTVTDLIPVFHDFSILHSCYCTSSYSPTSFSEFHAVYKRLSISSFSMPSTPPGATYGEITISSLPAHFSCPPDDDRQSHLQREEPRLGGIEQAESMVDATANAPRIQPLGQGLQTALADHATEGSNILDNTSTRILDAEDILMRDTPSPSGMNHHANNSDSRLAHSMSAAALSPAITPQAWPIEAPSRHRV